MSSKPLTIPRSYIRYKKVTFPWCPPAAAMSPVDTNLFNDDECYLT
jgi:hypothetical protein